MYLSGITRFIGAALVGVAFFWGSLQAADGDTSERPILVRNVTVIDGLGHIPAPMRDVLLVDGRIERTSVTGLIGDLPDDTRIIDGEGMTAMPGLVDLHVHIGAVSFRPGEFGGWHDMEAIQRTLNAHIYSGVTTVQDLGNRHDNIIALRDAINAGERIGPRILPVGGTIERLKTVEDVGSLTSEKTQAEIKELLDVREAAGIEVIKLYAGMSNWSARHLVAAANQRGMRAIADFWCTNLGITTFMVTGINGYAHGGCRVINQHDAEWMRDHDKFAMMTLMAFDIMGGHRPYADIKTRGFLKDPLIVDPLGKKTIEDYYDNFAMLRERFEDGEQSLYNSQLFGDIKHLVPTNQKNVVTLHEAGVLIGLGTDASFPPGSWPGEGMHFEMEMHVDAGLDPLEVIKMATYNGARILQREHEFGSIESGKIADILIVRGDPSENIRDTRNIMYVIKGGKLIDRAALKHR
jgi:imidazolonepropionase-like amidohydrolase